MAEKSFDELTDAELDALDKRKWTSEELTAAITMALEDHNMEAVVALLHRLALVDPRKAGLIYDVAMLTVAAENAASTEGGSE